MWRGQGSRDEGKCAAVLEARLGKGWPWRATSKPTRSLRGRVLRCVETSTAKLSRHVMLSRDKGSYPRCQGTQPASQVPPADGIRNGA